MAADPQLFHLSLHPEAEASIVLIHGLLSSHLEWDFVAPHLTGYHLLVVDAPGHSGSAHILPARIPYGADRVADLIRRHAHGGRAHVVGLSMGGFIALELARRYPELVRSVFATGAAPFDRLNRFLAGHARVVWLSMAVLDALPDGIYWWLAGLRGLQRHDALRAEMRRNRRWTVVRDVFASILDVGWDDIRAINEVRALAVAGGQQDPIPPLKRMGEIWKESEQPVRQVAVVRKAAHAWDLQFPELFAEGIKAWAEERPLPKEFEDVNSYLDKN